MRMYIGTCSVNRPLDDKSQLQIALQAEAIFSILSTCDDRLYKRAICRADARVRVLAPLELAQEVLHDNNCYAID